MVLIIHVRPGTVADGLGLHVHTVQLHGQPAALTSRRCSFKEQRHSRPGAARIHVQGQWRYAVQGQRRESRGGGAHVQRIANRSIAVELEGPTKLDDVDPVLNIAIPLYLVS